VPSFEVKIQSSDSIICSGNAINLTSVITSRGLSVTSHQWYRNGTAIPGANSENLVVHDTGTYSLIVNFNQCSKESNKITIEGSYNPNFVPDTISVSICSGDSLFAAGAYQTSSGLYAEHSTTSEGCDTFYFIQLSVMPSSTFHRIKTICFGESYFAGGDFQIMSGVYFDTLTARNGCDSIIITELTVLEELTTTHQIRICEGDSFFCQWSLAEIVRNLL